MESYSSYNNSSYDHYSKSRVEAQPSYQSSALHSIRKPLQPKPMMKKPIAPLPPTPPKIYQVEPSDFKQVVQRLTSITEFQPRRLQDMAPPPLNLLQSTSTASSDLQHCDDNIINTQGHEAWKIHQTTFADHFGTLTPTLSPASLAWCSFLIQSPGNMSTLEQGTVL